MNDIRRRILTLAQKHAAAMIRLRRELHQYPETALQEFKTQRKIAAKLKEVGCRVNNKIWKTAVVGLLEGEKTGRTIGIRSDMDALPVTEQTGLAYASKTPGRMHACGHDVHMSAVWGAACILASLRDELPGSVKLIYQPSEEVHPGGAKPLIDKGVLSKPVVSMMLGLHVESTFPAGKIGVRDGAMMAQADDFTLEIIGRSGHGARPHETVDAIVVACNVVTTLQNISSRQVSPLTPVVLSIGAINGGTATNVIADKVVLKGTARSLSAALTKALPGMIERIVAGVCSTFGARYVLKYNHGYPVLNNCQMVNDIFRQAAIDLYGKGSVVEITKPSMGGEDFAYFAKKVPSAMIRLGVGNKKIGADKPWHHPAFMVDEMAIPFGAALLAYTVIRAMRE